MSSYKVKSDTSAQLMYITDTGEYKIIVDAGDVTYAFDVPAGSTLYQLTDYQMSMTEVTDEATDRKKLGIYETNNKTFLSGFLNDDTLVSVGVDVGQLTPSIANDAKDILSGFFTAQDTIKELYGAKNQLWEDDEFLGQIAILTQQLDGDMDAAVSYFEGTEAYGDILQRLEVSEADLAAEEFLKTDYEGFQNIKAGNLLFIKELVVASGGEIPTQAQDYLADMLTKGLMTEREIKQNISGATDEYSPFKDMIDEGLLNVLSGKDVTLTSKGIEDVQALLNKYLPSHLHGTIDAAAEAGKIRNDPNYQDTLIDKLKKQRFAMYGMYDENISWDMIVASKKQSAKNILGVELKEDDPLLDSIIRMNDTSKEQSLLREEGLTRGYQKVTNDLQNAMMSTFGGGVVSSQSYVEGQ